MKYFRGFLIAALVCAGLVMMAVGVKRFSERESLLQNGAEVVGTIVSKRAEGAASADETAAVNPENPFEEKGSQFTLYVQYVNESGIADERPLRVSKRIYEDLDPGDPIRFLYDRTRYDNYLIFGSLMDLEEDEHLSDYVWLLGGILLWVFAIGMNGLLRMWEKRNWWG